MSRMPPEGVNVRYKIKAPSLEVLEGVEKLLEGKVLVYASNPKRRALSTGDLSPELIDELERQGAQVAPEYQYEPDLEAEAATCP